MYILHMFRDIVAYFALVFGLIKNYLQSAKQIFANFTRRPCELFTEVDHSCSMQNAFVEIPPGFANLSIVD